MGWYSRQLLLVCCCKCQVDGPCWSTITLHMTGYYKEGLRVKHNRLCQQQWHARAQSPAASILVCT